MNEQLPFPRGRHGHAPNQAGAVLARLGALEVRIAASQAEIRSALALRYRIFGTELGAALEGTHHRYGLETDRFDSGCDHIIVCDTSLCGIDGSPPVVGTFRALRGERAEPGYCAQSEFDLAPLIARKPGLVFCELGRFCVAPSHRPKRALEALWCGLWAYACRYRIEVYFGTASFPSTDPGDHGMALGHLFERAGAPPDWDVRARAQGEVVPLARFAPSLPRAAMRAMPPLIRGYMRVNAYVGSEAVLDHRFGTLDVMIIAPLARVPLTYRRHFVAATGIGPA